MNLDDLTAKFSSSTENQRKAIFSTLFIAGNKLQTLFDNYIPEVSLKHFSNLNCFGIFLLEGTPEERMGTLWRRTVSAMAKIEGSVFRFLTK